MTRPPAYDFETLVDRSGTGSVKWELMRERGGDVPAGIAPLSTADLDFLPAPEITRGLREHLEGAVLGYTGPTPALFSAIQMWQAVRHRWAIDTRWISMMPGVVTGLFAGVRAASKAGDGVALLTPAYPPMVDAIEKTGRRLVAVPLDGEGGRYRIDFAALADALENEDVTVLILCSPHNPTGRVWTHTELEEIAHLARANDVTVIADEIHADIVHEGFEHIPFAAVSEDATSRTITLSSASKSFNLAGVQTSWAMIENAELRAAYERELEAWGFHFVNCLGYRAVEIAYTEASAWLEGLLELIARNDKVSREFFAERFPEVAIAPLEGTFLQWIDFRPLGLDERELTRLHDREAHVFFEHGRSFGAPGFERLNLGTPTRVLEEALARLAEAHGR
ncbi:pyridoxal phosphate-dependent aminotransferase [Dermabacter hominis]|uniref:MalY/PatB family protein n=1 Tax=Dermabacter hominis TaxID=36740 RepID=UPI0021A8EA7B|nr:MalY/PatB family protein [Dermabacter hominis]MCT2055177.1 pyridoxal phosphate-dependent aminotransferase [Dermabacter hominis]MCT2083719.1 pyridoxal phosphate-dependent aminotransferase [Dermabacter hominis]MCT2090805.1 pyridoxal phosphate-dependent aminotransferase [Dermabacter hominis]MCT2189448.1 pyridoxal phosphate-dependent aminotransferase [Dermabacter hominis]MCT2226133.1 pyridoxal phosphate-dependent aminotransferase [Dermabacter hominis]